MIRPFFFLQKHTVTLSSTVPDTLSTGSLDPVRYSGDPLDWIGLVLCVSGINPIQRVLHCTALDPVSRQVMY